VTAAHTAGPWRAGRDVEGRERISVLRIVGPDYPGAGYIAQINLCRSPTPRGEPDGEANAARIVACVNACEGISTEALSMGFASVAGGAILQLTDELAQLRTERDALRAAITLHAPHLMLTMPELFK
jgi:hypothetical protein